LNIEGLYLVNTTMGSAPHTSGTELAAVPDNNASSSHSPPLPATSSNFNGSKDKIVAELERVMSVDDLVGTMRSLGRSPSEDEFQRFLYNHMFDQDEMAGSFASADIASTYGLATPNSSGTATCNTDAYSLTGVGGMPRVASLDFWRDLVQKASSSFVAAPSGMPETTAQVFPQVSYAAPVAMFGDPDIKTGSGKFSMESGVVAGTHTPVQPNSTGSVSDDEEFSDEEADGQGARRARAKALEEALTDESGKPKVLTKEELRRVRRMISNRESARRSRRRKLEQVQCLDNQVFGLRSENTALLKRIASMEQRFQVAILENSSLKQDVETLKMQLRSVTGGKLDRSSSLQRIASQEHLAKRSCGSGSTNDYKFGGAGWKPQFDADFHQSMYGLHEPNLFSSDL